jgi:hypothetical protein
VELVDRPDLGQIPVSVGLKQGCPCSPLLFSVLFDRVEQTVLAAADDLRTTTTTTDDVIRLLSLTVAILLFADDVVLMATTPGGLETLFRAFAGFCRTNRLTISQEKTKVMIFGGADDPPPTLTLDGMTLEVVPEFRYLGVMLDREASPERVASGRLTAARSALAGLCEFVGT